MKDQKKNSIKKYLQIKKKSIIKYKKNILWNEGRSKYAHHKCKLYSKRILWEEKFH